MNVPGSPPSMDRGHHPAAYAQSPPTLRRGPSFQGASPGRRGSGSNTSLNLAGAHHPGMPPTSTAAAWAAYEQPAHAPPHAPPYFDEDVFDVSGEFGSFDFASNPQARFHQRRFSAPGTVTLPPRARSMSIGSRQSSVGSIGGGSRHPSLTGSSARNRDAMAALAFNGGAGGGSGLDRISESSACAVDAGSEEEEDLALEQACLATVEEILGDSAAAQGDGPPGLGGDDIFGNPDGCLVGADDSNGLFSLPFLGGAQGGISSSSPHMESGSVALAPGSPEAGCKRQAHTPAKKSPVVGGGRPLHLDNWDMGLTLGGVDSLTGDKRFKNDDEDGY